MKLLRKVCTSLSTTFVPDCRCFMPYKNWVISSICGGFLDSCTPIPELYLTVVLLFQTLTDKRYISASKIFTLLQVVGVVDITTLNNRQYCVILDPVDKDGKPQLGQKRLVKVTVANFFSQFRVLSKITLL